MEIDTTLTYDKPIYEIRYEKANLSEDWKEYKENVENALNSAYNWAVKHDKVLSDALLSDLRKEVYTLLNSIETN